MTAACDFAVVREMVEEAVKSYMAQYNDSSHDWKHVMRVRSMAIKIAESLDPSIVDCKIVELAALLHDVGDFKFLKEGESSEASLSTFMESVGVINNEYQEAIRWIVKRVSFRQELANPTKEGPWYNELCCVQDADRLDAIGAIGIARCFAYNGSKNLPLYDADVLPIDMSQPGSYDQQTKMKTSNARNHFYEKLLLLKDFMKTPYGREEATRRHALTLSFIEAFDDECGLAK